MAAAYYEFLNFILITPGQTYLLLMISLWIIKEIVTNILIKNNYSRRNISIIILKNNVQKNKKDVSLFLVLKQISRSLRRRQLSLRVLNKGRASGFPPYGGKPFRLYWLSFNFRYKEAHDSWVLSLIRPKRRYK